MPSRSFSSCRYGLTRSRRGRTSPCAPSPRSSGSPTARCLIRAPSRVGDRLHVGDFLVHARDGRLSTPPHQLHGALRRLRHRVLEAPVGVRREAEQPGALGAQLQDLGDDRVVVVRAAVVAAVDEHPPDLLAQVAARPSRSGTARCDERVLSDRPLALLAARLGGRRRARRARTRAGRRGPPPCRAADRGRSRRRARSGRTA